MKRTFYFVVLSLVLPLLVMQGCKKDKTVVNDLVVVKRATGVMYKVNKSTGAMTEVMTLSYNSEPLTGLRGLVYDPATGKCFAGATNQGSGYFYSINLATGVATLLNDNADDNWDGIADLVIAPDGNVLSVIWSNLVDNTALVVFDKANGTPGTHHVLIDGGTQEEIWSPGALIYGSDEEHVIVGGNNYIFTSNLSGVVSQTTSLVKTTNIVGDAYVMDMEKVGSTVYSIVYDRSYENQYLVKLNTSTGAMTEVKLLSSGAKEELYHCLALIPDSKLK
jgi:hypothetical protein